MKKTETKNRVYKLILSNDDVHTFDFVIKSLVEVLGHNREQAEQCAYLVHLKGRCEVKQGSLKELGIMLSSLDILGLNVAIEK